MPYVLQAKWTCSNTRVEGASKNHQRAEARGNRWICVPRDVPSFPCYLIQSDTIRCSPTCGSLPDKEESYLSSCQKLLIAVKAAANKSSQHRSLRYWAVIHEQERALSFGFSSIRSKQTQHLTQTTSRFKMEISGLPHSSKVSDFSLQKSGDQQVSNLSYEIT